MKQLLIAACICFIAFGCNDAKKESTSTTTDTSAMSTANKMDETPAATKTSAPVDSATQMRNWEAYMTPGSAHQLMASWNGTWQGDISMWMAPGAPVQNSKGTAVNKMVMGGRYQVSNHTGNMMGMPFEGMSTLAYDNFKKKFVSTWIDNMGTGILTMEGTWDEGSKTLSMSGKCMNPMTNDGTEMTLRESLKVIDDKTQLMEMYGPGPDGKEYKTMEIKMTRKS